MKKKWSFVLLNCVLVMSLLLTACGGEEGGEAAGGAEGGQKILLVNNRKEPTSLDPPIGFDQVSYDVLNNFMEGLTRLKDDHTPGPGVASEWTVSEDEKEYTFKLRDDAKWSNGDPVKASDFEFAFKRMLDPNVGAASAPLAYVFEGAETFNSGEATADDVKVTATDDHTLQIILAKPAPWLLGMLANPAFFPVHQATVEGNPEWAADASTILSNGPFKLTEWKHDAEIKMVKNDQYWDAAKVKLDGVTFKMVDDSTTAYQLYQSGELHISGTLPPDLIESLITDNKAKVEDSAGTYFYRYNTNMEPFSNAKIRQAFTMAVDRQQIVDLVVKQKQKPATGFVSYGLQDPDGSDFRDAGGELVKTDIEEAKRLLAEGMKEEGYTTIPAVTLTYSTNDLHQKIAETIQAMLKSNLGVDIALESKEGKVLTDEQKKLQLQLSRSSWLPDFADPINFLDIFVSDSPNNRTGWSNPNFDKLINDAYNESDQVKRTGYLHEAESILMEEMPIMPLYFYNSVYMQAEGLTGVLRHAYGYIDYKLAELK
ncbi:peptide ABC transporter substrate-binding protein [Paenibacillus sp. Marseille-Q4541]|uniref:peptide ABC transporter substrate-binding protein n=1 Tax=Paenibacillus sp. Marseille-Q4541 TaxID=2831522 RepID=UPI001BA4DDF5|nr:peptide ABC transporter substrate-binding protein [Paenibacillus sp. Marseille-Q4541]